ncbi:hypothetical protein SAMN04489762_1228 [Terribacillus saccharophilus]|uniref:Uncharacterized protein n=1 Tax=Terribacillus saccharophilus TaxID=361277 RepID=A0AAX2EDS5_9BACI|nr:hypothetical protein SAMN04489762_1228 [Terribacillus saccharophilus]
MTLYNFFNMLQLIGGLGLAIAYVPQIRDDSGPNPAMFPLHKLQATLASLPLKTPIQTAWK